MWKKDIVEAVDVFADRQTVEAVQDKAFEFGLSLLDGGMIHLERHKGAKLFLNWMVHCGIPFKVVERKLPEYQGKHPERMAYTVKLATVGRRALGID